MRNFHVPLPGPLYSRLRAEADRSEKPATELVREAIEQWLHQRNEETLHQAIADYATQWAGTDVDLDADLEEASVEHLLDEQSP